MSFSHISPVDQDEFVLDSPETAGLKLINTDKVPVDELPCLIFNFFRTGVLDSGGMLPILKLFPALLLMVIMAATDYLLKFRKVNNLESLEKLYDHLNYSLTGDNKIINMYRAADHRRAERVSGGRLYDPGRVPKSI